VTFDRDFKVTTFSTLNISETTRDRAIVTTERQQEVVYALSNGDISNDLDEPVTRFQGHRMSEVNYLKKSSQNYLRDKVSIEH